MGRENKMGSWSNIHSARNMGATYHVQERKRNKVDGEELQLLDHDRCQR